ncbi:hypothetical protein PIB30_059906 [Stylosanthes scabra]|uniref:Uncharacterized protein n=1 Tax=Stylosanthes scabra TaxID=79078 RepID=A0ABU6RL02_9FABA|nr:hypothetical protein [Stylosanthes scabra]
MAWLWRGPLLLPSPLHAPTTPKRGSLPPTHLVTCFSLPLLHDHYPHHAKALPRRGTTKLLSLVWTVHFIRFFFFKETQKTETSKVYEKIDDGKRKALEDGEVVTQSSKCGNSDTRYRYLLLGIDTLNQGSNKSHPSMA